MTDKKPLIKIEDVSKTYVGKSGMFSKTVSVKAVDHIFLEIYPNETLGLVGESGCGKSTLGRTILRLIEPSAGKIFYRGQPVHEMAKEDMRQLRRNMQMIFQDPYASLNPRMTVGEIIAEPLEVFPGMNASQKREKVSEISEQVGIAPDAMQRYPHEFSGGQRQRIMIARAMITDPDFVVCDEPVSALDVSIRSQVLNLMRDLQKKRELSFLFISHDLSVVKHICDRVAVMYLGRIVEIGDKDEIFNNTQHPYTKALISAIPVPDVHRTKERIFLEGDVPSPMNIPSGCSFHTRCKYACEQCRTQRPELKKTTGNHYTACHRWQEI